jgi:hypothetical protein
MEKCWEHETTKRPKMSDILKDFKNFENNLYYLFFNFSVLDQEKINNNTTIDISKSINMEDSEDINIIDSEKEPLLNKN